MGRRAKKNTSANNKQTSKRYIIKCLPSLIRTMQIKITMRYHLNPVKMTNIETSRIIPESIREDEKKIPILMMGREDWSSSISMLHKMEVSENIFKEIYYLAQQFHP